MKLIIIFLLPLLLLACSGDVENKQGPAKKFLPIESQSVNPLQPNSSPPQEHISGSGESRISGAPSSSHISGQ